MTTERAGLTPLWAGGSALLASHEGSVFFSTSLGYREENI